MKRRNWSLMATVLTIGILLSGPASSWANSEYNVFKDYVLFKISEDEADNWDFDIKDDGEIRYKCENEDGCMAEVDTNGLSSSKLTIIYTCDEGAKIRILQGLVLIPPDCDGAI